MIPPPIRVAIQWLLGAAAISVFAWAVVRTFGLEGTSPLAAFIAFTPYVALAGLLLLGVCGAARAWAPGAIALIAVVALGVAVLPRALGSGEDSPQGAARIRILSANLYLSQADPRTLIALVDRLEPDVLSLQELKPGFAHELQRLGIRRRLPEHLTSYEPKTGVGLYSRLPLRRLGRPPGLSRRMLPAELLLPTGQRIELVDVHPFTPAGPRPDRWSDELRGLPSAAGSKRPWILAGDFNATLDHAALRDVLDRGYRDAGAITGSGLVATWPNDRFYPPFITIDHVLADRRIGIADYGVSDLPGSDHRAIWAELFLPSQGQEKRGSG